MITVDAELLAPLMADANRVSRRVDPRDEMLAFASDAAGSARGAFDYFRLGHDLDATVGQIAAWSFPGDEAITVLEFACGYGRILRHLVARFSVDRVTASDIDTDALRFVAAEFGVATLRSAAEPEAIDWPQRFDLIVVPSLFSHLPDSSFARWIGALYGLLAPRGVLAFSAHGDHVVGDGSAVDGILYRPVSEAAGRLAVDQYGTSYVTEAYVAEQIAVAIGSDRYGRVERGFWDYQDLYLVAGAEQRDPAEFSYVRPIRGNVDIVEVDGGRVRLLGWARADPPGLEVTVHAGDHQVATVAEFVPSPDVAAVRGAGYEHCRYEIDVDIAGSGDDQLLVVTATSGDQRACFYVQRLADLRRRRLPPWWRRVRALSKR